MKFSHLIAKVKKPHTIDENLIAPCAEVIVKRMLGEDAAKKIRQVSLSSTTVQKGESQISVKTLKSKLWLQ